MKTLLLLSLFLAQAAAGWVDLFDGTTLKGWTPIGTAEWSVADGALSANPSAQPAVTGPDGKPTHVSGYLRSDASYSDFDLTAEFWGAPNANSGIFVRCQPGQTPSQYTCYEVNISDDHATFPTGSIVSMHTTLPSRVTTAGKWSTMAISARGPHIVVKVDGTSVLDVKNEKFSAGSIVLQAGGPNGPGPIRFRNIRIRPAS